MHEEFLGIPRKSSVDYASRISSTQRSPQDCACVLCAQDAYSYPISSLGGGVQLSAVNYDQTCDMPTIVSNPIHATSERKMSLVLPRHQQYRTGLDARGDDHKAVDEFDPSSLSMH